MLKMIYKCLKCPVEYIDDFKVDHDKRCPKCGSKDMKIRLWDQKWVASKP